MALTDLLNQTCTIEPLTGKDKYNKDSWGTPVTGIACRVEGADITLRRPDDEVMVVTQTVWLLPDTVVDGDSRITLADGSQPDIFNVRDMPGGDGVKFYRQLMTGAKR
tara:strand:- start:16079 stop:16402 length:324 start_codon:yes stop_codon:yes gene_type:complete